MILSGKLSRQSVLGEFCARQIQGVSLSAVKGGSLGGRPRILGLSELTAVNLAVSLMEDSLKRRTYSALSITTTPVPLSGFVITISSLRFSCSIALCNALVVWGLYTRCS